MNTKEAKDFLAAEATEQAALDRIPFSDIEKRMMYFTESDPSTCDDPIGLNDEFEAEYDSAEYEAKMQKLLHRAYKRLKGESPQKKHIWDEAVRTLEEGDHYVLLVLPKMLSTKPDGDNPGNKVSMYGALFLIGCAVGAALMNDPRIPKWGFACLGISLLILLFLTMFFLAQQGYRALSRRKSG